MNERQYTADQLDRITRCCVKLQRMPEQLQRRVCQQVDDLDLVIKCIKEG